MMDGQDTQDLDQRLAALPDSIDPPADLWSGIAAAIQPGTRVAETASTTGLRDRWLPLSAVAGLMLVVGLGLGRGMDDSGGVVEVVSPSNVSGVVRPVSFGAFDTVGPGFVQDRAALLARLDEFLSGLDPAAREAVQNDLERLHRSQFELSQALSEDPANPQLNRLLMNSYQREVTLLQELNQLLSDVSRRTDI